VLAHPWASRHEHSALDEAGLADLQAHGLAGIEVDHQDHPPPVRERLRGIARNLGLVATGSSDYHGLGKSDHELACNTTAPDQLDRLLELAADAADRSARTTPQVVSG
jgi:3',5'-nucleoside bisphosphate phosphatase